MGARSRKGHGVGGRRCPQGHPSPRTWLWWPRERGRRGANAPPLQPWGRWLPTARMLVGANGEPHASPVLIKKERDSILCPAAQKSCSSWAKGASSPNSLISLLLAAGCGRKSRQLPAAAGDVSKAASKGHGRCRAPTAVSPRWRNPERGVHGLIHSLFLCSHLSSSVFLYFFAVRLPHPLQLERPSP